MNGRANVIASVGRVVGFEFEVWRLVVNPLKPKDGLNGAPWVLWWFVGSKKPRPNKLGRATRDFYSDAVIVGWALNQPKTLERKSVASMFTAPPWSAP